MPGTRIIIAVVLVTGFAAPVAARADGNGLFTRRPDQSRVRFLAELLRTDPDEKKRKAAVAELADADPRTHPEVMPALIAALKKDAAAVRAAAAEVIGKFKTTFPLAGAALESIAETDPDPTVRSAAKQALWDYHLNGYRSPKTSDAGVEQTAEPPFAYANSARATPSLAPMPAKLRPSAVTSTAPKLPEITPLPSKAVVVPVGLIGPRAELFDGLNTPRRMLSLPLRPIYTNEPPLAKRSAKWVPPPATVTEPPIFIRRPDLGTFGTPPTLIFELPAIVPNPGPLPGVTPFAEPTHEPPVRKVTRK
ncbi:MAG: HEAT repeat domain-containing protein [Planctomycetes bacterium]|nr:HEAT repeat domain-containing protein [Planctomycetota bacterium]